LYDPVTKNSQDYLNDVWVAWISNFGETLVSYLGQYGVFVPNLTTAQRNDIQSPIEGQMIYNTDLIAGPPRTGALQVWQVKADVGAWRTITTTP
jgi:hypothetical protein